MPQAAAPLDPGLQPGSAPRQRWPGPVPVRQQAPEASACLQEAHLQVMTIYM